MSVFVLVVGWLTSVAANAQIQGTVFDDNVSVNPKNAIPDVEETRILKNVNGEECDNPYKVSADISERRYTFQFFDHILVHSGLEKSRCVVLQNLPFSGYYKVNVIAMYTKDGGALQSKEEYRLAAVFSDSIVISENTVPDQNESDLNDHDQKLYGENVTDLIENPKPDYDYYLIDHGLFYFEAGDNIIRFYTGSQFLGENNGNHNSVDFYSIELVIPPHIVSEPEFTANYSNSIQWIPILNGAYTQDVFYFDTQQNIAQQAPNNAMTLSKAAQAADIYRTTVFGSLQDGHKYGYFVEAVTQDGEVVRSDTTFSVQDASPPERVSVVASSTLSNQIVNLFWQSVDDATSGVASYMITRSENGGVQTTIDTVAVISAGDFCQSSSNYDYCYSDTIRHPLLLNNTYMYRVNAIDSVGNISFGHPSELVINIPVPQITVIPQPVAGGFYAGAKVLVQASVADLMLPEYHYVRFQAARDSLKFFDSDLGRDVIWFDSDSLLVAQNVDFVQHEFDFTNSSRVDSNFIEGHRYLLRAQFIDQQGNFSAWTDADTQWVIPDCFPPNDISYLSAESRANEGNTNGSIDLEWGGASDQTSGIDSFLVYRNIGEDDSSFKLIARTSEPFYSDPFDSIQYNGSVTYRIGSVDRVGNLRDFTETNYETTARCQTAPACSLIVPDEKIIDGIRFTKSTDVFVICRFSNFEEKESLTIIADVNGIEQIPEPVGDVKNMYNVILPARIDTSFIIKVRAFFPNKATSLWSQSDSVTYVDNFPQASGQADNDHIDQIKSYNFPNPFNPSTTISYHLAADAQVTVDIYNVQGRRIKSLINQHQNKGTHHVTWHGVNSDGVVVSSGIYYYKIRIEGEVNQNHVQRILLLK